MMASILIALTVTVKLASNYKINKDTIFDLAFWLVLNGLIGARIYDCFLEYQYYLDHPLDIFKIWQGGLAIHGALLAGIITIYFFAKNKKLNFLKLTALITPGLALGQAIGRWGNYFNQELFGLPTNLPWGIPIAIYNRPTNFITAQYFHPTFLYESLGNLIIFVILISIHWLIIKNLNEQKKLGPNNQPASSRPYLLTILCYLFLYSTLRFFLEFLRIDFAPTIFGWRWPQLVSLITGLASFITIIYQIYKLQSDKQTGLEK